jgi:hypothetical protein
VVRFADAFDALADAFDGGLADAFAGGFDAFTDAFTDALADAFDAFADGVAAPTGARLTAVPARRAGVGAGTDREGGLAVARAVAPAPAEPAVDLVAARAVVTLGRVRGSETNPLKTVPGRNRGTEVFLIFTLSPVRGLRPTRGPRTTFSKEPKPVIVTFSPRATVRVIVSITASRASAAAFLLPRRPSSSATNSALFTGPSGTRAERCPTSVETLCGPAADRPTSLPEILCRQDVGIVGVRP